MHQVAPEVWQVALAPRNGVNAWVVGDVLVDAGTAGMGKKLPQRIAGHAIAAHTITHADPDHVGGSQHVVDALGVPFWAPAGDAPAIEAGRQVPADNALKPVLGAISRFKTVPIARRLQEGDEVGPGFVVVDTPGHSPGHIAFWRERDRLLVCGDVWFNMLLPRLKPGLREPFGIVTPDPARNREAMRKLVALEPDTACFGHGPVLRNAAGPLRAFTAAQPG